MNEQQIRQLVRQEIRANQSQGRFTIQNKPNHAHTGLDGTPQVKQSDIIPSVSVAGSITFAHNTVYKLNLNANFTPSNILAYGIVNDGGSYVFRVIAANATVGAVYSNNGASFIVASTITGGTTLTTDLGSGNPSASGTLTKVSGTGDATITFSSVSQSSSPTIRAHTVGSAQLGPAFYFEPLDNTSVITGNKQYPFPTLQPDGSTPSVPVQGSSYISVSNAGVVHALTSQFHLVDIEYPTDTIHARVTVIGFSKEAIYLSVPTLDLNWQIIVNYVIT